MSKSAKARVSIVSATGNIGKPEGYSKAHVNKIEGLVEESLKLAGFKFSDFKGNVAIKVNAVFDTSPGLHTTDPRVLEALINVIKARGKADSVKVIESTASDHMRSVTGFGSTTEECLEATGIAAAARRAGAEVIPLEGRPVRKIRSSKATMFRDYEVFVDAVDADTLVYLPHMKTHVKTGVTLALKLAQGLIPHKHKARCHREDLRQKFADMLHGIRPDITIVDGLWAEQGQGPTSPYDADIIRDMGTLVASRDPVAVDAVTSAIMGFDTMEVGTTRIAHAAGLGTGLLGDINIKGELLSKIRRNFRRPNGEIEGVYPNVNAYVGGACRAGCQGVLRNVLDPLNALGFLSNLDEPINIVVGLKTALPQKLKGKTFVVGDCTVEHKSRGIFIEGCCPLSKIGYTISRELVELMPSDILDKEGQNQEFRGVAEYSEKDAKSVRPAYIA